MSPKWPERCKAKVTAVQDYGSLCHNKKNDVLTDPDWPVSTGLAIIGTMVMKIVAKMYTMGKIRLTCAEARVSTVRFVMLQLTSLWFPNWYKFKLVFFITDIWKCLKGLTLIILKTLCSKGFFNFDSGLHHRKSLGYWYWIGIVLLLHECLCGQLDWKLINAKNYLKLQKIILNYKKIILNCKKLS